MQKHKPLWLKAFLPLLALLLTACPNPGPFDISLNPTSLTITQGGSKTTQLTITLKNSFSGTVNLNLVNPPAGVSLSPSSVEVGGSEVTKILKISTTADTPVGRHTLTLETTSGSIRKTAKLTLTVNQAPTFNVNTTDDTIDDDPGDGTCADGNGNCSLRAAVMEANALKVPVVINIPEGTYKLTRTSDADEQGGDLDIKSNVTLKGAGAGQTILEGVADRVLEIYQEKTVRVEGVTIQNGKADDGGGIYNDGTLTLTNSTVRGNAADKSGGGIYNDSYATLTLTNSTVGENFAVGGGGGIYNGGTLTLTNSTVRGNAAYGYGGGIFNYGTLTLTNSTVIGNATDWGAGGIYNGYGGTSILSFSTLTLNQGIGTSSEGGGIYIASGTVKLKGVILAGNTSKSGPECKGSLTSLGYNLIKNNAGCDFTAQDTDITGQDPALGPLADNGGPTQTHLPAADSPVLDKVPTGDCTTVDGTALTTDQRGVSRPQGTACDIGAVERE